MGYDKLVSFINKNIGNNATNQYFIDREVKGNNLANHIFFDIQFVIYYCINLVENDINYIIKLLTGLLYNDNKLIIKKINNILNKDYWKIISFKFNFDGNNEIIIIENFINKINNEYINSLIYWCIFNFINNKIKYIHDIDFVKSINIFFDGIPSYSKIQEQRRRRIKTFIESQNRKKLFSQYFNNIDDSVILEDDIYYEYFLFIRYQYSFSKSLGPYSKLIKNLSKFLDKKLKEKYVNKKIYIDKSTNLGEADFKIFDYIIKKKINSEIYIHSCDSDFVHLILNFQLQSNDNKIFYFVKYNLRDETLFEIINAKKIISILKEKYKQINNLTIEPNINIIYDFLFVLFFFGNDIIPFSFEISSDINLKIIFSSHYELFKNNNFIVNVNSKNLINFKNLEIFLRILKEKNSFTIIILNRTFKISYNFILLCTNVLKYNIDDIIKKLLIPYLSYQGFEKKIDSKNDVRYLLYKKHKITVNPIKDLSKDIQKELEEYFTYIFDFSNIDDYGLIRLEKYCNIEKNSYQTLYNKLVSQSTENNFIELEKVNFINNLSIDNIYNQYLKLTNDLNVSKYLEIIIYLSYILFNNLDYNNNYYFGYYSELLAPSLDKIIDFLNKNDMNKFQGDILINLKKSKKNYYFNELSHHLFITPYLMNSEYVKDIKENKNLNSILNLINININGIWYLENEPKKFKLKDIDPLEYLKTYNLVINLFNSNLASKIYYNTNKLLFYKKI